MIRTDEKSQAEARDYVLYKPLSKPSTTVMVPIAFTVDVICGGVALGFILSHLIEIYTGWNTINRLLTIIGTTIVSLLCSAKPLLILCVKCYQHYASENVRRSCLCKPTCSEYAILAIKNHCLIKAVGLIYIRLFRTCTGGIYKIDFPYSSDVQ